MNPPQAKLASYAALAIVLIGLIVAARMLPHPPNFTPVMAVGIFAAFWLPSRLGATVVIAGLLLSDVLLGGYSFGVMASVYVMSVAGLVFGRRARRDERPTAWILGGSVVTALAFYLVTNAAVWAFTPYYAPDVGGLFASLAAGLPFLKWTLAGNVVWTIALFSVAAWVTSANRVAAKAV